MAGHGDFTQLLEARAAERPDHDVLLFLRHSRDGVGELDTLSYAELSREARRLAVWLREHGAAGERVLIAQDRGWLFAASFLGCLYAGAVAVPVPPSGGSRHRTERMVGILRDTAAKLVLSDAVHAPALSQLLAGSGHGDVVCLAADKPDLADPDDWRMPDIAPQDIALLQYTSGSTGDPKGVMVSHRNLLANQRMIQQALGTGPDSRIGGWLPLHHDMGLVGQLLHPLWLGASGVMMEPSSFVRHPLRWLQMIEDYQVTVGGGPNLGYELCVQRIADEEARSLDLSRWAVAVDGAEPVREQTLRDFAAKFAPAGFAAGALRPCYGLAEATLLVAGGSPGTPPRRMSVDVEALEQNRLAEAGPAARGRTLVSCGGPAPDLDILIVDPETRTALPPGAVGEIWVRGSAVAAGYWNRPADTERTFRAVTADGEPGYLRTGDLGVLADGELFVTGRLKDLVIVAGRNLHPQDVERTLQKVSVLFSSAAVFALEAESDQVVVVQEVRSGSSFDADLPELVAAVQRCLSQEFELAVQNVVLVRPGTVRRTTSGKLRREAMRRLFLANRLQPLYEVVNPEVSLLVAATAEEIR
ncbi:fatty acyl-AMP ligase [Streptacidiphilus sp. PB12-B1b]|uniref:fatty acyl-AMP ligase n=1 Tax=Streptacidiphilus sp. PB12-B1b TaxID=2705012 RepID=UPI0015F7BE71|nr:fatty acyl-AMP ligase [Streptacidiphilus sp. PB12-B1b]QMU78132.1 fatty acyl-AMP ligase [Streptacidiphilus sp. PB12-B1b]